MSNQSINFLQRFGEGKIPEHIEKPVYESNKYDNIRAYLNSKYATKEYADRIKHDPDERHIYYGSRFATDEELSDLLKSNLFDPGGEYYSWHAAAQNPYLKEEHLGIMLNSSNPVVRTYAAKHKNATTEQLDRALNDNYWYVRKLAAANQNINSDQINKALSDSNPNVRHNVAYNVNLQKHQLLNLLQDENLNVRRAALRNINYDKYFPYGHESEIK